MNDLSAFRHIVIVPPQTSVEARQEVKRVVQELETRFGYDETRFFLAPQEDVEG